MQNTNRMIQPLLTAREDQDTFSTCPVSFISKAATDRCEEAEMTVVSSPIASQLSVIRAQTLQQFSKKMSLIERHAIEQITQAIIERLMETTESGIGSSCPRHHLEEFNQALESLFSK